MPLPLLWIGAGLAAAYTSHQLYKEHQHSGGVATYPGESSHTVHPVDGAIVCCGIYGAFEHTGIWLDEGIVELKGNGLVRHISPQRFLKERSGDNIFIACDENHQPLVSELCAEHAASQIFTYHDYHLLRNNCHQFVWRCISQRRQPLTSFSDLNNALANLFKQRIAWLPLA